MKWYLCFNDRVEGWLDRLIKVCVTSALRNTSLEPHCIYSGKPGQLVRWLESKGVNVIVREVYFADELRDPEVIRKNAGTDYNPHAASGFFLPFEIPYVESSDDFVLYTDTDVIFLDEINLSALRPNIVSACAEVEDAAKFQLSPRPTSFNSGIMLMNLPEFRKRRDLFLTTLRSGNFFRSGVHSSTYDQWALNTALKDGWTRLDDNYNWRACWPANPRAKILHFHGPKPSHVADYKLDPENFPRDHLRSMIERFAQNYQHSVTIYQQFADSLD